MDEAQWYVVHTYSGYENKVAQSLETIIENRRLGSMIEEVRVPTAMMTEVKDGKEKQVERKLFPSYVLVKMIMTDDSWYIVRNTRGVTGFVGPGSKPVPLSKTEVDQLCIDNLETAVDYKVGDSVEVTAIGPMEGFVGTVDEIDLEHRKVKVTISMFGRQTPAELSLSQVKPV